MDSNTVKQLPAIPSTIQLGKCCRKVARPLVVKVLLEMNGISKTMIDPVSYGNYLCLFVPPEQRCRTFD